MAANNGRIANEGECDFKFSTVEGNQQNLTFQIAEVNKALGAVSYLVDHGYRVVFDQVSYVEDLDTGEKMYMEEKEGMYVLKMWVRNGDC